MADVRINPITGEPVIVSTTRAHRPGAWSEEAPSDDLQNCPFCPGHETLTPPEVERLGGETWSARVVPNKYPAIEGAGAPVHEVLIDSRSHGRAFDEMSVEDLTRAILLWQQRAEALASSEARKYVCVFRNEGRGAGQSIPHPHSQVLALDFIPARIARELEGFRQAPCALCVFFENASPSLMIDSTHSMLLCSPPAPRLPLEMWITSKRHLHDWGQADPRELATLLLSGVRRLRDLHPGAPFNLGILTAPLRTSDAERFHFYVEITPRLTNLAGFEMSTAGWINIESPERAAEKLRDRRVRTD